MTGFAKSSMIKLISAGAGIAGIEVIEVLPMDAMPDGELIKAICQAVVAIVAVITLLKNKRKEK